MELLANAFKSLIKVLTPPRAFSWQTLVLLSLFSWVMSLLSTNIVQNFISSCGWIFLICGVSWATTENPPKISNFSIGPWITGALVCIFLFGPWERESTTTALLAWPPISAFLACLKEFFDNKLKLKIPSPAARQRIVILFTSNLLISCWIQFYFVIQNWLQLYPTLLADNFQRSAFVVRIEPASTVTPRGALMLKVIEDPIREQLNNKPWPVVEKWLLEAPARVDEITKQMKNEVSLIEEDSWWYFKPEVKSNGSGYRLKLQAIWKGPRSQPGEYAVEKSCQINRVDAQTSSQTGDATSKADITLSRVQVGDIKCEPLGRLWFENTEQVRVGE